MIELDDICIRIQDHQGQSKTILKEINLQLSPGDRVALLGNNGAGKSTLLKTLAGELKPYKGKILLPKSMRIACLFQNPRDNCFDELTIKEHFQLVGANPKTQKCIYEGLKECGLANRLGVHAKSLSGGQMQQLAVLLAAARKAQLWLMDEPTSALDPKRVGWFWQWVQQILPQEAIVVLVSHSPEQLSGFCNRYIAMQEGEIVKNLCKTGNTPQFFQELYN